MFVCDSSKRFASPCDSSPDEFRYMCVSSIVHSLLYIIMFLYSSPANRRHLLLPDGGRFAFSWLLVITPEREDRIFGIKPLSQIVNITAQYCQRIFASRWLTDRLPATAGRYEPNDKLRRILAIKKSEPKPGTLLKYPSLHTNRTYYQPNHEQPIQGLDGH
jgi:hypothetical protein